MRRELILYEIIINNFLITTQIKLIKLKLMIKYLRNILKKRSKRFKIKKLTIINLIEGNKNKIEKGLKALKKTESNKIKEINLIEEFDKNKGKSKIKKMNKNEIEETKSRKVKKFKVIILSKVFFRIIEFYKCLCALYALDFTTLMQINVFEKIKKLYKIFLTREIINRMKNDLYEKNYVKLNFETHVVIYKNIK